MKFISDCDVSDDGVIWSLSVYSAPLRLVVVVNVLCSTDNHFLMLPVVYTCTIVLTLDDTS